MDEKVEGIKVTQGKPDPGNLLVFSHPREPLYSEKSTVRLIKQLIADPVQKSQQENQIGEVHPPIDLTAAAGLVQANTYHETCLRTKVACTVGLGFKNAYDREMLHWKQNPQRELPTGDPDEPSPVVTKLEPLVSGSVLQLLMDFTEDLFVAGGGAIEVVRGANKTITALWFLPARTLSVHIEKVGMVAWHWVYRGEGKERRFARFGDKDRFLRDNNQVTQAPEETSEVIYIRNPNSISRHFGLPDYLSAVPAIELCQMIHQQQFDFFKNRGVPEFMLFFLGANIDKETWDKIEVAIKANIGSGNAHKSIALQLADPNVTVQLEKLAVEGKTDNSFTELNQVLAMEIVSAHRTPPLLAGLHIPQKIGAVNELANALLAFQLLYIDQKQALISETLASTIGKELGLTLADFQFRKVTDRFDMDKLDTMSRMKDEMGSPAGKNRDLGAGLKKEDLTPEAIGKKLAELYVLIQTFKPQAA